MSEPEQKPKPSLVGCVLAIVFMVIVLYGSITGATFFLWGNGLTGAIAAHNNPAAIREFETTTIYGSTIESSREEIVIGRSLWSCVRDGILAAVAVVTITAVARRRMPRRVPGCLLFIGSAAVAASALCTLSTRVLFHLPERRVEVRRYLGTTSLGFDEVALVAAEGNVGGGRSGTRHTSAMWEAYDVALEGADGSFTRVMSLPFETREFASRWRDELARRTGIRVRGD